MNLLLVGLAAWRLTSLIREERGPFLMFTRFRELCGVTHNEDGAPVNFPDTEIGLVLSCSKCLSIWVGLVILLAERTRWGQLLAAVLTVSAGVVALDLAQSAKNDFAWFLVKDRYGAS